MKLTRDMQINILIYCLFFLTLSILYPFTATHFGGDYSQSYCWARDIYTHYSGYLSWSVAPGYNLFFLSSILSLIIGSITYDSVHWFYFIANFLDIILLTVSGLVFVKIVFPEIKQQVWIRILPFLMILWMMMALFANPEIPQSITLQATDYFAMLPDGFFLVHFAWFFYLLNQYTLKQKTSKIHYLSFVIVSLYLGSTNLRFLSHVIMAESLLTIMAAVRGFKLNTQPKNLTKHQINQAYNFYLDSFSSMVFITCGLVILFVIGYLAFFCLETYSTTARFALRGGEVTTAQSLQNAIGIIPDYLSGFSYPINFIFRVTYLVVLVYGFKTIYAAITSANKITVSQIFAILTSINFILVTLSGLFSHGTVFLDPGMITHYYELSAFFAFYTVASLVLEFICRQSPKKTSSTKNKKVKNTSISTTYPRYLYITTIGLLITAIFSSGYCLTQYPTAKLPNQDLYAFIKKNSSKYNLHDGMGDYFQANAIAAQDNDRRYVIFAALATNLNYNWIHNITVPIGDVNFLVFTDNNYKQNALYLLQSKVPNVNYTELDMNDHEGILVFDSPTTANLHTILTAEQINSRSWFYISNYGTGQYLWAKMPWNKNFIEQYHTYTYYGSMLSRTNSGINYLVNQDFSITVPSTPQNGAAVATEMIHSGKGSYHININYSSNVPAQLVVVNVLNNTPLAESNLTPNSNMGQLDFALDHVTPIAIIVGLPGGSDNFTLNKLTFSKNL